MNPVSTVLAPIQNSLLDLHRSATTVQSYENSIVHGTLQTENYARAIFEHAHELYPVSREDIETALQARMARRDLFDGERKFEMITTTRALTADVAGTAVLREQLAYLLECMERPGLTLGVIPTGTLVGTYWDFTIINSVRVEIDQYEGPRTVTDPASVGRFRDVFDRLRRTAVYGDDARALISNLI
ncbi:DUF5753 domain-containing protein [Streptomyces sp. CBMA123]|uniref:DUF5753 domain-containing protein n=1 Tax=Streptomyces sp. CBMA123 TaxID=1896313 RepID=UPI001661A703|nr:DUF5753 domain-containing protein [Streptomyces sp. CBMA123]MBD0692468.1 hypothetical protein [Streptomyces sp. CBMA123]